MSSTLIVSLIASAIGIQNVDTVAGLAELVSPRKHESVVVTYNANSRTYLAASIPQALRCTLKPIVEGNAVLIYDRTVLPLEVKGHKGGELILSYQRFSSLDEATEHVKEFSTPLNSSRSILGKKGSVVILGKHSTGYRAYGAGVQSGKEGIVIAVRIPPGPSFDHRTFSKILDSLVVVEFDPSTRRWQKSNGMWDSSR